ncbi:hypothetical protein GCM10023185_08460 [Hymenobacter saemangeumensis]|uniref:M28 family peptidase n=1 Tax=Hymenobacter saemangeumensis TaxID=1084522 RepID=A0ABP8I3J1_9BACT
MATASSRPYAGLPLAWATLIAVLTLTPSHKMPRTPVWELLSFDTAAHAGVFAVLAILGWWAISRQRRWPTLAPWAGTVVFVACILFGGLIEVLQHTMKLGRHGDWTDLLSDGIGAALGLGLCATGARVLQRPARPLLSLALLALLSTLAATPARAQELPRARKTIEKLASPAMLGRGYVGDGDKKAAAYLRGRLRELKLEPLAPDYTQRFTLDVNTFPGKLELQLQHGFGPVLGPRWPLQPGRDFIAAPNSGSGRLRGRRLCYLDSAALTSPDGLREFFHCSRLPCTVVLLDRYVQQPAHLPLAVKNRVDSAAAVLSIVPKLTASLAPEQTSQLRLHALPHAMLHPFKPGTGSPAWTANLEVEARLKRSYPSQNLAAVVRGSAQPDSFLVVSAHYDHLGTMGKKAYFPGANDNASGVALLLELAAHYAKPENRPACSIAFLLFGAEEAGLIGSSYFVAHPLLPLKNIKFLVNLDLLGTGEQGATVVNGRVHESAFRRLSSLNEAGHYLPALGARGRAANSDHYPFSELGVPAFFIYTRGGSPAYHDVHDQPGALSLAGFSGAFGLVRDFLNTMGGLGVKK